VERTNALTLRRIAKADRRVAFRSLVETLIGIGPSNLSDPDSFRRASGSGLCAVPVGSLAAPTDRPHSSRPWREDQSDSSRSPSPGMAPQRVPIAVSPYLRDA
jgi:hypothetical protein